MRSAARVLQYWDTSALVKLRIEEADSPRFRELSRQDIKQASSSIVQAELLCVLLRREREGNIRSGSAMLIFRKFQEDCAAERFLTVPYDSAEVRREVERLGVFAYSLPKPILIRSLDLIHVATASVIGADTLVTADSRLSDLAVRLRMRVPS